MDHNQFRGQQKDNNNLEDPQPPKLPKSLLVRNGPKLIDDKANRGTFQEIDLTMDDLNQHQEQTQRQGQPLNQAEQEIITRILRATTQKEIDDLTQKYFKGNFESIIQAIKHRCDLIEIQKEQISRRVNKLQSQVNELSQTFCQMLKHIGIQGSPSDALGTRPITIEKRSVGVQARPGTELPSILKRRVNNTLTSHQQASLRPQTPALSNLTDRVLTPTFGHFQRISNTLNKNIGSAGQLNLTPTTPPFQMLEYPLDLTLPKPNIQAGGQTILITNNNNIGFTPVQPMHTQIRPVSVPSVVTSTTPTPFRFVESQPARFVFMPKPVEGPKAIFPLQQSLPQLNLRMWTRVPQSLVRPGPVQIQAPRIILPVPSGVVRQDEPRLCNNNTVSSTTVAHKLDMYPTIIPKLPSLPIQTTGNVRISYPEAQLTQLPLRPIITKIEQKSSAVIIAWDQEDQNVRRRKQFSSHDGNLKPPVVRKYRIMVCKSSNPTHWYDVGYVNAVALPMACQLSVPQEKKEDWCSFAICGIDTFERFGPWSEPMRIKLDFKAN